MKKMMFLTVMALVAFSTAYGQQFQVGSNAVNVGVGFGTALSGLGTGRPAISASYEHGLWEAGPGVIALGAYAGITGYTYKSAGYTQKWNYTVIGARGTYHYSGFTSVPQLDPYGGLMLGYNIVSYSATGDYTGPNAYGSGLGFSLFLGSRWFFSDNLAAFAELGYGVSILNAGVSLKF